MTEEETRTHVLESHVLPDDFQKADDVSWFAVHKLLHDLSSKRGEDPHT